MPPVVRERQRHESISGPQHSTQREPEALVIGTRGQDHAAAIPGLLIRETSRLVNSISTLRWPSVAASGPPQVRHENLTPITEYFEFCCDLSFLRGVPYSQPSIRFFQHKERCLLNHKCEKQVVSNSNSFKVPERQVTSADDREKYFARCSINPYRSL